MTAPDVLEKYKTFLLIELKRVPKTAERQIVDLNRMAEKVGDLLLVGNYAPISKALNDIERERDWDTNTTAKLEGTVLLFYRWALREQLITVNPYPLKCRHKHRPEEQPSFDRDLDKETIERVLFYPNWTRREYCQLRILFACGLRRQELVDLNIEDVDLEKRYVRIRKGKRDKWRYVPMDEETAAEMKEYIEGLKRNSFHPALFQREDFKERLTGSGIWKSLDRVAKKMGIKFNPKKWRASFATYFLEKGAVPSMVSKWMGHSRLSTTLEYYAHHRDEKAHIVYDEMTKKA